MTRRAKIAAAVFTISMIPILRWVWKAAKWYAEEHAV